MKTSKFLVLIILFLIILIGGCRGAQLQPTAAISVTETALWQFALDLYATQTQIAQFTPMNTPKPTLTPFPTLDFTPSGKIYYIEDNRIVSINGDGQYATLEIDGFLETPYGATWSPDKKQLAFWCEKEEEQENYLIVLCIVDTDRLVQNNFAMSLNNVKRIFFPIKSDTFWGKYLTIVWSTDGKYILADYPTTHMVDYAPDEYPCVVEVETAKADCSSSSFVMQGLFVDESNGRGIIRGTMQWSPIDCTLTN